MQTYARFEVPAGKGAGSNLAKIYILKIHSQYPLTTGNYLRQCESGSLHQHRAKFVVCSCKLFSRIQIVSPECLRCNALTFHSVRHSHGLTDQHRRRQRHGTAPPQPASIPCSPPRNLHVSALLPAFRANSLQRPFSLRTEGRLGFQLPSFFRGTTSVVSVSLSSRSRERWSSGYSFSQMNGCS